MRRAPERAGLARLGGILLLAALPGCAEFGLESPTAAAEAPAPITDPVVAFAAEASPGAEGTVVLSSTGQTARVRLVRAYAAASGRECREVLVGTGGGSASRLLCSAGSGWREARPLLRSAAAQP